MPARINFTARAKYGNKKTVVDGIKFDSIAEAARYGALKLMVSVKMITDLELQKRYKLHVNGELIGTYVADFVYRFCGSSVIICEDVKGTKTPVYNLKKKLMKAIHGIEIREHK